MACKWIDICEMRDFEKQGLIDDSWKRRYCEKDFKKCKRYQAVEKGMQHDYYMMPDGTTNKELSQIK